MEAAGIEPASRGTEIPVSTCVANIGLSFLSFAQRLLDHGRRTGEIAGRGPLSKLYPQAAWLNPESPNGWWQSTIEVVRRVFPMYPLTLEGLTLAVDQLTRGGRA